MSDSLDNLDKALEAERKTQRKLPDVEIPVIPDEPLDTIVASTLPAAPAEEPEELDSGELQDVVEMTQPLSRTPELERLLAEKAAARSAATASPTPAATVPPAPITERNVARTLPVNSQRPALPSIAPVAIDVTPTPPPTAASTQKLSAVHAIPPPRRASNNMFLAASIAAGGLALVGVVAAFVLTSTFGTSSSKPTPAAAAAAPRKAESKGVRSAVVDRPETAPSRVESSSSDDDDDAPSVPVTSIPSVTPRGAHASSHAAPPPPATQAPRASKSAAKASKEAKEPPPPPAPTVEAPPPPAPVIVEKPTTGTIVLASNPNLMTIVVDGQHRRVTGGRVVVTCGFHRVRAGISETQAINVPCGGTTSL